MSTIASPREGLSARRPFPPDCAARFQVERLLGQGGFGAVYLARQIALDRPVAVKVLLGEALRDTDQVERFVSEARVTAKIEHPGVVKIFDHGAECGIPWIAYEYIPGRSLRQILDSGGLRPADAVAAVIQIAAALDAAHGSGVLHRDIKPDNVLEAARGHYKVTDFGLAKWAGAGGVRTATGLVLGTPAYMAPELILGQPASAASDIYALGIVLYELLTGTPPFQDENPTLILERHLRSPVPPPSRTRKGLPEVLDRIVLRALAKSPGDRYASVRSFQDELERAAGELRPGMDRAVEPHARAGVKHTTVVTIAPPPPHRGAEAGADPAQTQITRARARRWTPWILPAAGTALLMAIALHHWSVLDRMAIRPPAGRSTARSPDGPRPSVTPSGRTSAEIGPPMTAGASEEEQGKGLTMLRRAPGALTGGWARFYSFEEALRGKETGPRTLAWIRTKSPPIDFGSKPVLWANWISLNRWLGTPGGHWVPPGQVIKPSESADLLSKGALDMSFRLFQEPPDADSIKQLMEILALSPGDGRVWLILGWLLEEDGRPRESRVAYASALALLNGGRFSADSPLAWSGLARALSLGHGQTPESDWLAYIAPDQDQEVCWEGLQSVTRVPGVDRAIYYRSLSKAIKDPLLEAEAMLRTAESYVGVDAPWARSPAKAVAMWTDGFHRFHGDTRFAERLVRHYLERGDLDHARPVLARLGFTSTWKDTVRLLTQPGVDRTLTIRGSLFDRVTRKPARLTVFRLLEAGLVPEAVQQADQFPADDGLDTSAVAMELWVAAGRPKWAEDRCRKDMGGDVVNVGAWWQACGILATPRGREAMEGFLGAAKKAWPGGDYLGVAKALWLSRMGKYKESLAQLRACGKPGPFTIEQPSTLCEIVSRPIWMNALGRAMPGLEEAAADARSFTLPNTDPRIVTYWKRCTAGDLGGAAREALELFDSDPRDPQWSLVQLWDAIRAKDRPRFDLWTMRARIVYRQHLIGLWPLREVEALQKRFPDR